LIFRNIYEELFTQRLKPLEYKVGTLVRISRTRLLFEKKSATQTFTSEIFEVCKAVQGRPSNFYFLRDTTPNREILQGSFTPFELVKVGEPTNNDES